jgi:hypothetical protein
MLRAAVIASILIPALANADSPSLTPSAESGAAPTDSAAPPPSPPTDPVVSKLPPSTVPAPSTSATTSSASLTYAAPSSFAPSLTPLAPGAEQPLPPAEEGTASYRHLTLGLDVATVGLFALGVKQEDGGLIELSLATYVLGAPIVHLAKGRSGRALASVGMRLALPIVGGFLGQALRTTCVSSDPYYDECDEEGPSGEAAIGALVGIATAMIVDSAYLAGGDPPTPKPQPTWSPTIGASQGGFSLGAAGSF